MEEDLLRENIDDVFVEQEARERARTCVVCMHPDVSERIESTRRISIEFGTGTEKQKLSCVART